MSDSANPWTISRQASLSMGFSRQEYWSELPFPSPGDLPDPGIKSGSPALQADSLPPEPPGKSFSFSKKICVKNAHLIRIVVLIHVNVYEVCGMY